MFIKYNYIHIHNELKYVDIEFSLILLLSIQKS